MAEKGSSSHAFEDYPHDKRIIIHPVYLNSKATLADGRRIAAKFCAEQPTLPEIMEVLTHLGFEAQMEDKTYPRDLFQRGRVRVLLKDPVTGEPKVPEITTRKALLQKIGTAIPNLKSRKEAKLAKPPPPPPPGAVVVPGQGVILPPGAAMPPQQAGAGAVGAVAQKAGSNKKKHKNKS